MISVYLPPFPLFNSGHAHTTHKYLSTVNLTWHNFVCFSFTGNRLNCGENFTYPCVSNGNDSGNQINHFDSITLFYNVQWFQRHLLNLHHNLTSYLWGFSLLAGSSQKPKVGIIVGIVGGFIILLLFGGLLFFLCKGRQKGCKGEAFVDVAGYCYLSYFWMKTSGWYFLCIF